MARRKHERAMTLAGLRDVLDAELPWPPTSAFVGDVSKDVDMVLAVARARQRRGAALGFSRWQVYQANNARYFPELFPEPHERTER